MNLPITTLSLVILLAHGLQAASVSGADTATWVQRIEISGVNQPVGYTDDLFFGTSVPEPGVAALAAASMVLIMRRRRGA